MSGEMPYKAAAPFSRMSVAFSRAAVPFAGIAGVLCLQLFLLFEKPFNWDEYLHYGKVYQLRDGTLSTPFQTLLMRLIAWSADIPGDLFDRMMAARLMIWLVFVLGLAAIYSVARRFGGREDALWSVLAYLAGGYVFAHGFAIRTDPVAMAILMGALAAMAHRPVNVFNATAIGAAIGIAGVITVKSVFYAPCFLGIAWLKFAEADRSQACAWRLAVILPAALITYGAVLLAHRSGLAPPDFASGSLPGFASNGMQWLTEGFMPRATYSIAAFITAPLFLFALTTVRKARLGRGLPGAQAAALLGLVLPLASLLFYRNAFPYFFVFIMAPVAAALPPAMAALRERYGRAATAVLATVPVLATFATTPREELSRQRAVVAYAHDRLPPGSASLDHAGLVADRPLVVGHLLSGIGLRNYRARGVPLVAQAVEQGRIGVVVANTPSLVEAMEGKSTPEGLTPDDVEALHGNFAHIGGPIWLPGKTIPQGNQPARFEVKIAGPYTADATITVDGRRLRRGETIRLAAGPHEATGERPDDIVLWAGTAIPPPPPAAAHGEMFTRF